MHDVDKRDLPDEESASGLRNRGSVNDAVAGKLRALAGMDYTALRAEWRRLHRSHPPKRVARDLLIFGIAWKIQEQAHGGLSAATKRHLADLAKVMERNGDVTRTRVARLKPGAKLIREWRGKTHTVIILDDGFEWRSRQWRSLSVIAREITGAHWSGPRFFAVNERTTKQAEVGETGDA